MKYIQNQIKINDIDTNVIIWRYMDFTKYVSLLEKSALFFCSCKNMEKMDPYEGYYTKQDLKNLKNTKVSVIGGKYKKSPSVYRNLFLNNSTLNCWHINDCESAGMWKLYSDSKGIAIKSTVGKLTNAIECCSEDKIEIDKIKYINYINSVTPVSKEDYIKTLVNISNNDFSDTKILNILKPFYFPLVFTKRKEFEHEKEIRLFSPIKQDTKVNRLKYGGKFIKVDLTELISEILISPESEEWFVELVKDVTERFLPNNNITINKSKLFEKID